MKIIKSMFLLVVNGAKGETRTLKRNIRQHSASLRPCFICQTLLAIATFRKEWGRKWGRHRGEIIHEGGGRACIAAALILSLSACGGQPFYDCQPVAPSPSNLNQYKVTTPVLTPNAYEGYAFNEPNVLRGDDGVYRMWVRAGGWNTPSGIIYATSADGLSWTRGNDGKFVITDVQQPFVVKYGDGYRMYVTRSGAQAFDLYENVNGDGVTWDLLKAATLTVGYPQEWDSLHLGNMSVWHGADDQWRMIYEANGPDNGWIMGYATSSDGENWLKDSGNPINIDGFTPGLSMHDGGPDIYPAGNGIYFMMFHGNTACAVNSQIWWARNTTPYDLHDWEPVEKGPVITRTDEAPFSVNASQIGDPSSVEAPDGGTFVYFEYVPGQWSSADAPNVIEVADIPSRYPMSEMIRFVIQ